VRVLDLPPSDRPRERLLQIGSDALSDRELLALLLGSGARDLDAIELAARLIDSQGGLHRLAVAAPQELTRLPGMGPAKAAQVVAAFRLARRAFAEPTPARITRTADLAACAAPLLRGLRHERVVVIACDKAGSVVRATRLTEGGTDRSLIPVRDVLTAVLAVGGMSFGVAHNHPSGDLTASDADRSATARLREGAAAVGLRFLDHVVISGDSWRRVTVDR
jgi:DNA repair protein RadC